VLALKISELGVVLELYTNRTYKSLQLFYKKSENSCNGQEKPTNFDNI